MVKKGIEVERVEFKDVRLPVQLQRAMATEAEASREARAKVKLCDGKKLQNNTLPHFLTNSIIN